MAGPSAAPDSGPSEPGFYDLHIASGKIGVSNSFALMLGYDPGQFELTRRGWLDLVHPDDRPRVEAVLQSCIDGIADSYEVECRMRRATGEWLWIASVGRTVDRSADGQPLRLTGSQHDISRRREQEESLWRAQALIDNMRDGAFWVGSEAQFVYVNEAACRTLGYSREELLTKRVFDIDPHFLPERWQQHWQQSVQRGPYLFETEHRRKDGSLVPMEISITPMEFGGERVHCALARDITERKQAALALHESEQRFRDLSTMASDWFWEQDEQFRFTYFSTSEAMRQLDVLDMGPSKYLGKTRWAVRTNVAPSGWAAHRATLEARQPFRDFEYSITSASGATRWFSVNGQPVFDASGRFVGYRGTGRDITERKLAEQALQESEAQLRRAQRLAHVGSWRLDVSSQALQWSDETYRMFGIPSGQPITADDFFVAVHPEDRERVRSTWEQAMSDGTYDMEHRIVVGSAVRWVRETAFIERDETGQAIVAHGAVQDVTDRKTAELALRESEARFRRMVDSAPIPIGEADANGTIRYINARFTQSFGYLLSDIPTLEAWFAAAYPDPAYRSQVAEAWTRSLAGSGAQAGTAELIEVRVRTKQGTELVTDVFGVVLGDTLMAIFSDQTERARAQKELKNLNATLAARIREEVARNREKDHLLIQQARFAAMGEMIGNIAHQWRQPINALALLLANIKDAHAYGDLSEDYLSSQVERGDRLIQQMSSTIEDFRNFFRPNREPRPFRLGDAVRSALSIVESAFEHHNIHIESSLEQDATVMGFSNEYSQVVLNLLTNAKEAIEARGVLPGRVALSLRCDERDARLVVQDNGGGVSGAVLPRIFDPYFTTRDKGTGIGLYMSKMIIESSMRGRIEATNAGDGASFTITTPIAPIPLKARQTKTAHRQSRKRG